MVPVLLDIPVLNISTDTIAQRLQRIYRNICLAATPIHDCLQSHYMIALLSLLLGCLLLVWSRRSKKRASSEISMPLQALLTVVIPTWESWPPEYAVLLDHSCSIHSKTIGIQLSNLIRHVCSGSVEFRDYNDLVNLFCHQLRVYGWLIIIDVGPFWWITVFWWLLISKFIPTKYSILNTDIGSHVVDLDFVAHTQLETSIRDLQSFLRPKASLTIEFTTLASNVSYLSASFILSSLPFLPRKSQDHATPIRTSTPLLINLHDVVELLSSGPTPFTIITIANISDIYSENLQAQAKELIDNRAIRTSSINRCGINGWREHRFFIAWEVGLLSAGHLARWKIVIEK